MNKIDFRKLNNLLLNVYKAKIIDKKQFKAAIYGPGRDDVSDDIYELTERIICGEDVVFYLINDAEVLNKTCKCVNGLDYPSGETIPFPLSGFMPYIVLVVELSDDNQNVVNYAKWGSFSDNIFEQDVFF